MYGPHSVQGISGIYLLTSLYESMAGVTHGRHHS